ncbi:hypothetical protein MPPM_4755 [Methylorubrum populi]|uniref:Uncharacterized protein n=1 Tax=Methylorubrum populi TaxID=223967 RepID=A0A160PMU6_9HYPH|nr:hypothetical protein [Methylorubrum populi]BAU93360.1 hypothetical protein MPPM_4755 [Methylorubrum populi]
MVSQILNIIPRKQNFETGTNEDWVDGFAFVVAASPVEVADPSNKGNGTVGAVTVQPYTPLGTYRIVITDIEAGATFYSLSLLQVGGGANELARGVVGAPLVVNGMSLTVNQGSTAFAVDDGFSLAVLGALQDVSGIRFDMQLRRTLGTASDYPATVVLSASTEAAPTPTLVNAGAGGTVNIAFPAAKMQGIAPALYDYDLIARDGSITRRVYSGTANIVPGVTRVA